MSGTSNLRALAYKVLERDNAGTEAGTRAKKFVPQPPMKTTPVGQACPADWGPKTTALIDWFLKTEPPAQPFELQQAVTIAVPARYWEYLRGDIAAGPNRARGKTGALQHDLHRLHQLFGGD